MTCTLTFKGLFLGMREFSTYNMQVLQGEANHFICYFHWNWSWRGR